MFTNTRILPAEQASYLTNKYFLAVITELMSVTGSLSKPWNDINQRFLSGIGTFYLFIIFILISIFILGILFKALF